MNEHTQPAVAAGSDVDQRIPAGSPAQPVAWRSADSAPKTGEHILVTQLAQHGFGICGGAWQDWCAVVHYWPVEGEAGFYLSSGASATIDDRPMEFSHWMPLHSPDIALELRPFDAERAERELREAWPVVQESLRQIEAAKRVTPELLRLIINV